ncbi:hypothetical protein LIA77_08602 [Sarocladium implicatum]|nr:hypothetical protein LIA77_08602 [Sarocladium implicatum]
MRLRPPRFATLFFLSDPCWAFECRTSVIPCAQTRLGPDRLHDIHRHASEYGCRCRSCHFQTCRSLVPMCRRVGVGVFSVSFLTNENHLHQPKSGSLPSGQFLFSQMTGIANIRTSCTARVNYATSVGLLPGSDSYNPHVQKAWHNVSEHMEIDKRLSMPRLQHRFPLHLQSLHLISSSLDSYGRRPTAVDKGLDLVR